MLASRILKMDSPMTGCVVWFVVLSRVVCSDAATLELKC